MTAVLHYYQISGIYVYRKKIQFAGCCLSKIRKRVQKRGLGQEGFGPDKRTQTSLVHAAFSAFMHKDNHLLHWTLREKVYYKRSKEN